MEIQPTGCCNRNIDIYIDLDIQGGVTKILIYIYELGDTGCFNRNINIYMDLEIQGVVTEILIFIWIWRYRVL